ncbi:NifB/NifX family molybdenum-iron cluster-binding protein [Acetonema longum]|uniref:Dinitrogenase iron-molybdenum cofactor biosynthesis domain-containing protein n=1 Tax=Acetonema longum DSM 6540 TaxID=1009370 RepID=F7NHC6_9FIRM|nr:NifB/NifX family molybdenum-iron cluster-binding protein [Acetonema longum]EGO64609.1 hypothetical protein ALO_07358 [Acetonema longum DSM 6540]
MKIAIPVAEGKLSEHFGHCVTFAVVTVDNGKISKQEILTPPPHAPGVIPNWIADLDCTDVLAGGMGEGARSMLRQHGVTVICGAPQETPETLVDLYLRGKLVDAGNGCGHSHHHGDSHGCGTH